MKNRSEIARSNKRKGKRGEQEVADILTDALGVKFMRVPNSGAMRGIFDGDVMKREQKPTIVDNTILEVKNTENIPIKKWLKQVKSEMADANVKDFILFFKYEHQLYSVVKTDYLAKLLTKAQHNLDINT
mgnify:CR=1 FL=1